MDVWSLIWTLEPAAEVKMEREFSCRLQGGLEEGVSGVTKAMDLPAERCIKNPWLHKIFFSVADSRDPGRDGLVLGCMGG